MAVTAFKGKQVGTIGDLPGIGETAPDFTLITSELSVVSSSYVGSSGLPGGSSDSSEVSSESLPNQKTVGLQGQRVVLNIFPSIDTGVCAKSVRVFNERASELANTTVLCVSADLPFAAKRFCGAEGIDRVLTGSTFRSSNFLDDYGVRMIDGPLAGLCARAVVVIDTDGKVLHTELVSDIVKEPDYDAAVQALS